MASANPAGAAPLRNPTPPRLAMPAGACDTHCHIFGPFARFPLPADRSFTPHETPETALRRMHDRLGISRAVIVHSQGHGMDHAPLLAALVAGEGRYRGVAVVRPDIPAAELARYHAAGVRGVRFNFLAHLGGAPRLDDIAATMARVRPYGWHVAIHVAGRALLGHAGFIAAIDAPVVIDHMARPNLARDGDACREALLRLLDSGRVWIKLSGADRLTASGPPYADVAAYARVLHDHAPERMLWGTDWPHVNITGEMPDEGSLANFIEAIAPGEPARQRLLVDNPAALFGF